MERKRQSTFLQKRIDAVTHPPKWLLYLGLMYQILLLAKLTHTDVEKTLQFSNPGTDAQYGCLKRAFAESAEQDTKPNLQQCGLPGIKGKNPLAEMAKIRELLIKNGVKWRRLCLESEGCTFHEELNCEQIKELIRKGVLLWARCDRKFLFNQTAIAKRAINQTARSSNRSTYKKPYINQQKPPNCKHEHLSRKFSQFCSAQASNRR